MNSIITQHLNGKNLGRFPVWMMRQAGRYLPRYQAIRKNFSFWQMATQPDLIAEVSLLPLEVLDVDGIIFFSDILTIPYSMGVPIEMRESVGPFLENPLKNQKDFEPFLEFNPEVHTSFLKDALLLIKKRMPIEKTLIGFAAAPWTLACYLIEGKTSKNFANILAMLFENPNHLTDILQVLAKATLKYARYQLANHVELFQLFDTWISYMPRPFFKDRYLPILASLFEQLEFPNTFTLYFARHCHHILDLLSSTGAKGFSVDSQCPLKEYETKIGPKFFLQGNLDPSILLTSEPVIRHHTRLLVEEARKLEQPPILNLSHGILPSTPEHNARIFIEEARTHWL